MCCLVSLAVGSSSPCHEAMLNKSMGQICWLNLVGWYQPGRRFVTHYYPSVLKWYIKAWKKCWQFFCMWRFQTYFIELKCVCFDWSLFLKVQLTISQHWFRKWLGAKQALSHYLNQSWPSSLTHVSHLLWHLNLLHVSVAAYQACFYPLVHIIWTTYRCPF